MSSKTRFNTLFTSPLPKKKKNGKKENSTDKNSSSSKPKNSPDYNIVSRLVP